MKSIFVFIFCLLFAGEAGSVNAQQAKNQGKWLEVFSDDFTGNALDPNKWTVYQDCWGGGNQERQCYTKRPENVSVHDGYLDLSARFELVSGPALPLDQRNPNNTTQRTQKPFSSGKISTLGLAHFQYGRFEVRAKLPNGQGMWPAIWLLPEKNNYGVWPGSGEIDIEEAVNLGANCVSCLGGVENNIYGTIHYGSEAHHNMQQKNAQLPKDSLDGWHVYAVEWSADNIRWFLDDRLYYSVKIGKWGSHEKAGITAPEYSKAPFDQPFYIILNVATGGLWPESHDEGGVSLSGFPKSMLVDWVRVYQCALDPQTGRACD